MSNIGNYLTGQVTQGTFDSLPQVTAPSPGNYQISGLNTYQNTQNQLSSQLPGAPNLTGATQGTVDQQTQMQQYLQSVAMGQQPTAADQMLQNSQAQGARQLQAGTVSAGGMNPALAMRQLFAQQATQQGNMAGQAAQQKLQEQQQYSQLAGQSSQALYSEQFQNQQQQFANQMGLNQAQSQYAQNIFDSNRAQTSFNVQYQQNQTAYQQYMRAQAQQQAQNNASGLGSILHGVLSTGGTIAGGIVGGIYGGPVGAMAGASAGGYLGNFAGGALQGAMNNNNNNTTTPVNIYGSQATPASGIGQTVAGTGNSAGYTGPTGTQMSS